MIESPHFAHTFNQQWCDLTCILYDNIFLLSWTEQPASLFSKTQLKRLDRRCKDCINLDPRVEQALKLKGQSSLKQKGDDDGDAEPKKVAPLSEVLCMDKVIGSGATAVVGSKVAVHYVGRLEESILEFDASSKPFRFTVGRGVVIRGWEEGILGMRVGGRRLLKVPPQLAYGAKGAPPRIPPNATLLFDISLVEVKKKNNEL
jgi:FKBP-type peptidyl-prolyl cis-trans isomerase